MCIYGCAVSQCNMYLSLRLWSKKFKSHCHPSIKEAQQSLGHRVRLGLTLALAGVGGSGKEAPSRGARWRLGLRLRRARTPPNPRVQKQRFSKPVAVRVRERTFVIVGNLTLKYTGKVMSIVLIFPPTRAPSPDENQAFSWRLYGHTCPVPEP